MKQAVKHFIRYPIWANVLMITVLVFGFLYMRRLKTSFFPEVETNRITVDISYPGTSPEEIEESLILKIENNLRNVSGVDRTTSQSRENHGTVTVEVLENYDVDEVYDDIKSAVDRIAPYPAGAEKPVVKIAKIRTLALLIALYGDADLWALKERAESLRDELIDQEGISQVSLIGIPDREIAVTVSESTLRAHGLSFSEIAGAIQKANVDLSGGSIKTLDERLLIRAYGRRDYAHEIRSVVLRTNAEGNLVRLGDVAQVREQWEDTPNATYYNGQRAIIIQVDKTIEEDILDVSRKVNAYLDVYRTKHPEISLKILRDTTVDLRQRIELLVRNGALGFVLVLLTLGMFLNGRLSFWVAVGIPVSFAGMFVIAYLAGLTINVISLMGMIIVVGILVDDAIVVAENIYQKHEQGVPARQAAVQGLMEVIAPVLTAVTTTIFAFLPFFFFAGTMGRIIYQLALVVIGALIFSLIESLFILPAHLAHSKGLSHEANRSRPRQFFDKLYRQLAERFYGPALRWGLRNVWVLLAIPVAYVLITIGLLRGGLVEFSAFPHIDRDDITMNLTMTTGTRDEITDSILSTIEANVWRVNERLKQERSDGRDVILFVRRHIGSNPLGDRGGHAGYLAIELLEGGARNIPAFQIQNRIRKSIGGIPGSQKLSFSAGRWGKAISISLLSNDLEQLEKARGLLKEKLNEYPALTDISDSDIEGWREVRLRLKPEAFAAGLTLSDIAGQVRQGFFGQEVQRFQRGEDEIQVWVRYSEQDRRSLGKLENMHIRSQTGVSYPLSAVADYSIERGRVVISHLRGKREIRIESDQVDPEQSVASLMSDIRHSTIPAVLSQVRGVSVSYEGRQRQNKKFIDSLRNSFPIALVGIAVILILVFRSVWQASLIFIMIPLGIMGAVWGHLFHGYMISRLSTFGVIALAGIVINDSIVLVDRVNRNLREGMRIHDAIYEAGLSRLRPIILTTVTTVAGMAPLIAEPSRQAQFLIPMAISLSYGLILGSFFILFTLPGLLLSLNRLRLLYARLFDSSATAESVEPAVKELSQLTDEPPAAT